MKVRYVVLKKFSSKIEKKKPNYIPLQTALEQGLVRTALGAGLVGTALEAGL